MFYRLQVGTPQGEICGYQWREIDQVLFVEIIQGQKPQADSEAQSRDSTDWNTAAQNRVMHYLAVWDHGTDQWQTDLDLEAAQTAWQSGTYPLQQSGA